MSVDPTSQELTEVAAAIASRRTSSEDVVRACLERIAAWQPSRNCFLCIDGERALMVARQRDAEVAAGRIRGPLHGVPLGHKDMFYSANEISTGGSLIRKHWKSTTTATVLTRLNEAGAITLGALNMSEFAAGPTGHNVHYGHCRNAFSPDHIAGGSSSGSATAVAARLVYGSLGSDTGASIRVPASVNGVVGLKPTYGLVSRYGALPRSWSLDHIGPIARSPRDCAVLLGVIAGHDDKDSTSATSPLPEFCADLDTPIAGVRIGVARLSDLVRIDDEVAAAFDDAMRVFFSLGATLSSVSMPPLGTLFNVAETIIKCEAASLHRQWFREREHEYSKPVHNRIAAGFAIPATQYIDALRLRPLLTSEFMNHVFSHIDILALPVIPCSPPTIDETDIDEKGDAVITLVSKMTMLTRPFNLLGLPAISVPAGFDRTGLPIGLQLVGRPFREALLLQAASALLNETQYHKVEPTLSGV